VLHGAGAHAAARVQHAIDGRQADPGGIGDIGQADSFPIWHPGIISVRMRCAPQK